MPFRNKRTESSIITLAMYSYNNEVGEAIEIDEKEKIISVTIKGKKFDIRYQFPFDEDDFYNDVQILEMIEEMGKKIYE